MRQSHRVLRFSDSNRAFLRTRRTLEPACIFCQHDMPVPRRPSATVSSNHSKVNVPKEDNYQPATTWHGLERIGGETEANLGWKFNRFALPSPLTSPTAIERGLRQALIRVVSSVDTPKDSKPLHKDEIHLRARLSATTVQLLVKYPSGESESWGQSWLQIPLDDRAFKFAILKEFYQITGIRIIDPLITKTKSILDILKLAVKPELPKKLADSLLTDGRLTSLSNVTISTKRQTPVDKEKLVGRWKVIQKELIERSLPRPRRRRRTD